MALDAEVLFVNPDYMKRLTNLNGSIEDAYLVPSIILAQDKYVQQYLGTALFDKLKDEVEAGTLTGVYETLLDKYVRKATLWWTMVELLPSLYIKMDNGSLVIRTGDNTSTISPDDLHREIERSRQNANHYTYRLYRFLCNNTSDYPEYTTNQFEDIPPQDFEYYQSGMTIGGEYDYEYPKELLHLLR
jgi:hypothetical protein